MRKKKYLYIPISIIILILTLSLGAHRASTKFTPSKGDYVVLVHGLIRSSGSLDNLAKFLADKGYSVLNFDYLSTKYDITTISREYLKKAVFTYCTDPDRKIHFITHSLGGIVVKDFLGSTELPNLGRVVMLAPPNKGSELADVVKRIPGAEFLLGPNLDKLGAEEPNIFTANTKINFEVGIVAGNASSNMLNSEIIPGDDDGKVSVESTKLTGMKDFIVVPETHNTMINTGIVWQAADNFIRYGAFSEASSNQLTKNGSFAPKLPLSS
ncbi:MAG: alpha/beta hydrolase [Patescibacteria group bacterium]|nr:alpha/beta hydrolase [Patescibacteria group bacterium]